MIVINPSTRQFNIPGSDLVFGVESDNGAERKYFQCPRYVGNSVDVASSFVRINYRNANGEVDAHMVEDLTIDGDNVLFSWGLHPKVTMYKGQISFVLCITGPDLKVKWHTTIGKGQVLEGLEPENEHVVENTEDLIAQLITMVEAQTEAVKKSGAEQVAVVKTATATATAGAVAEIEAKRANSLASIPGDYTALSNSVRGAANAIRGKASGSVVRVDDVSPMEHYPVISARGKNFVYSKEDKTATLYGVTCTFYKNSAEILVNGTATAEHSTVFTNSIYLPKGTYTVSVIGLNEAETGHDRVYVRDVKSNAILANHVTSSVPRTFTFEQDTDVLVSIVFRVGSSYSNKIVYVQIEKGELATDYSSYIDPTTVTVKRFGKNLLDHTIMFSSLTHNGVTMTRSGDLLKLNGTLTVDSVLYNTYFAFYGEKEVPYTFSYKYVSGEITGNASACVGASETKDSARQSWVTVRMEQKDSSQMFWLDYPYIKDFWIYAYGGTTFRDFTVKVQLEKSRTATGYEPHNGETQIPGANGTVVGLKAVSPTMTLLTDKPGVTIECEYTRDTNKVIEEILNKITALGG